LGDSLTGCVRAVSRPSHSLGWRTHSCVQRSHSLEPPCKLLIPQGGFSAVDAVCDRPPVPSPANARATGAGKVSRSMNADVSRRGCFPETVDRDIDSEALVGQVGRGTLWVRPIGGALWARPVAKCSASSLTGGPALYGSGNPALHEASKNRRQDRRRYRERQTSVSVARDAPEGIVFRSCERVLVTPAVYAAGSLNAARPNSPPFSSTGPFPPGMVRSPSTD
jgi:hypothetical protein